MDVTGRAGQSMTTLWQAGLFMSIKKVTRRVRAWLKQKNRTLLARNRRPTPPGRGVPAHIGPRMGAAPAHRMRAAGLTRTSWAHTHAYTRITCAHACVTGRQAGRQGVRRAPGPGPGGRCVYYETCNGLGYRLSTTFHVVKDCTPGPPHFLRHIHVVLHAALHPLTRVLVTISAAGAV